METTECQHGSPSVPRPGRHPQPTTREETGDGEVFQACSQPLWPGRDEAAEAPPSTPPPSPRLPPAQVGWFIPCIYLCLIEDILNYVVLKDKFRL